MELFCNNFGQDGKSPIPGAIFLQKLENEETQNRQC